MRSPVKSSKVWKEGKVTSPVALSVMRYAPFFKRKKALKEMRFGMLCLVIQDGE